MYTGINSTNLTSATAASRAVNEIASNGGVLTLARGGGVAAQGATGLPTLVSAYDENGEPIEPTRYWRVGDVVGAFPLQP